jgi:hypothetical protein
MRAGEGYYAAMRQAFLDIDVTIGHARGYRLPTPFWFWELFPADLLYGVFLLVVVVGSLVLLTRITTTVAALPWVTLVLLYAGRSTGFADEANWEAWMLVELWVVPLILGTVVAWRSRRDGWAAALAAAATLCRETAAVLLIGGLIAAVVDRRPWRPWAVSSVATGLAYLAHVAVASGYADPPGTFAQLFGTGDGIDTVLYMTMWNLPGPVLIGAVLWALGCWRLWHRPERWLLAPLFALPLTGLLVNRPYWGILLIPLMVTFAVEQVVTPRGDARTAGAGGAGSSPPPRTRSLGRGNPAAEVAPPSG